LAASLAPIKQLVKRPPYIPISHLCHCPEQASSTASDHFAANCFFRYGATLPPVTGYILLEDKSNNLRLLQIPSIGFCVRPLPSVGVCCMIHLLGYLLFLLLYVVSLDSGPDGERNTMVLWQLVYSIRVRSTTVSKKTDSNVQPANILTENLKHKHSIQRPNHKWVGLIWYRAPLSLPLCEPFM
jgi:hypothetical protein